ncbi:hypothetical protein CALCODRAFT_492081 [Calocera cornea HHB12733]|uniref:F-box domain-containing protein n=1 Tax=Calocera cornea HHB12733 TaxID=1353952 RepID=A0A165INU7_9BASI|nr:hypothetical protein CALCODRAFT_492081 [Calocera cornea HHB12733]
MMVVLRLIARHPIWAINEVVLQILRHMDGPELVAMACTARRFRWTAASLLWQSASDGAIRCLLDIVLDGHGRMEQCFETFQRYAGLVQNVDIRSLGPDHHHKFHLVESMRPSRRTRPMLPSISSLKVRPTTPGDLGCALSLLHPQLEHLSLDINMDLADDEIDDNLQQQWNIQIQTFLLRLHEDCPSLVTLKLIPPDGLQAFTVDCKRLFSNMKALREYAGDPNTFTVQSILTLGRLPSLTILRFSDFVSRGHPWDTEQITKTAKTPSFSQLRFLYLNQPAKETIALLNYLGSNLVELDVSIEEEVVSGQLSRLLKSIASFHTSLELLHVHLFDVTMENGHRAGWDELSVLHRCRNLCGIWMNYQLRHGQFRFSDGHLFHIQQAWPRLVEFEVRWKPKQLPEYEGGEALFGLDDETQLTIMGLLRMIKACNSLAYIHLTPLDLSRLPDSLRGLSTINRSFLLQLEYPHILSPYHVALLLAHCAPKIDFKIDDPHSDEQTAILRASPAGHRVALVTALIQFQKDRSKLLSNPNAFHEIEAPEDLQDLALYD